MKVKNVNPFCKNHEPLTSRADLSMLRNYLKRFNTKKLVGRWNNKKSNEKKMRLVDLANYDNGVILKHK